MHWGTTEQGKKRAREAGAYPEDMACVIAHSVRRAYVKGLTPECRDVPLVSFARLRDNLAISVEQVRTLASASRVQRAGAEGGEVKLTDRLGTSSSSSSDAPLASLVKPTKDHWVEGEKTWVRHHVVPRARLFAPGSELTEGAPRPRISLTKEKPI